MRAHDRNVYLRAAGGTVWAWPRPVRKNRARAIDASLDIDQKLASSTVRPSRRALHMHMAEVARVRTRSRCGADGLNTWLCRGAGDVYAVASLEMTAPRAPTAYRENAWWLAALAARSPLTG